MRRALAYGLLASLFFAFTFIFNRSMNLEGGYWLWSAALRFIFMLGYDPQSTIWRRNDDRSPVELHRRREISDL